MFKIYEFVESKTVAAIPSNWIQNNKVRWNDALSAKYIKLNLFPKNKWKIYDVQIVTSKTYDSYEKAEADVSKVLNCDKTDIETDDLDDDLQSISTYEIASTKIIPEKLQNYSSSEDEIGELINPFSHVKPLEEEFIEEIVEMENIVTDQPQISIDINKENNISYMLMPTNLYTDLTAKLDKLQQSVDTLQKTVEALKQESAGAGYNNTPLYNKKYKSSELLPLQTISDLLQFDEHISNDEYYSNLGSDFKHYLLSKLTAKDLRSVTKLIIGKVYSLILQEQINYTGVKGKQGIKTLLSTNIILETICEFVPELILLGESSEKMLKAEAELMYQLQHYYDRKRSIERKLASNTKKIKQTINTPLTIITGVNDEIIELNRQ